MAANILDELDDIFDSTTVQRTAEALGESAEAITACIRPAVAELLRAIIKRCESRDAADKVLDTIAEFEGAVSGNYYLILEAGSTAETIELGYRASSSLYRESTSTLVFSLLRIASISRPGAESLFHLLTALVADLVGTVHVDTPFRSDVLPMYLRKQQDVILSSIPEDILTIMGFIEVPKPKGLSQDQLGLNAFAPGAVVDFTPPIRETEFSNEMLAEGEIPEEPTLSSDLDDVAAGFSAIADYQAAESADQPQLPADPGLDSADSFVIDSEADSDDESLRPEITAEVADEEANEDGTNSASQDEVIREIVRRQKLRDQLNGGGGLSHEPTLPPTPSPREDLEIANERQRELRELLNGRLGVDAQKDRLAGDDDLDGAFHFTDDDPMLEEGEYLEEIDDEFVGDDYLDGGGFELSSEQNLEIRFKAMIVGVLLSLSWLYAFAKGQRRDLLAQDQPKPQVEAESSLAEQITVPTLRIIDQANVEPRIDGDSEIPSEETTTSEISAITWADDKPMKLPPIRWTDATEVSLGKESQNLPSTVSVSSSIGGLETSSPIQFEPVPNPLTRLFETTRKESWDSAKGNQPNDERTASSKEHAVEVRFESTEEDSAPSDVTGFRVVDDEFRIPVFEEPRDTGTSYYSD